MCRHKFCHPDHRHLSFPCPDLYPLLSMPELFLSPQRKNLLLLFRNLFSDVPVYWLLSFLLHLCLLQVWNQIIPSALHLLLLLLFFCHPEHFLINAEVYQVYRKPDPLPFLLLQSLLFYRFSKILLRELPAVWLPIDIFLFRRNNEYSASKTLRPPKEGSF